MKPLPAAAIRPMSPEWNTFAGICVVGLVAVLVLWVIARRVE